MTGSGEPVLAFLPEEVLLNMRSPASESAFVWNLFYPVADSGVSLRAWAGIRPLWGSPALPERDDRLVPYFWGYRVDGTPLEGLAEAAVAIAGRDDRLEVDLLLVGESNLVVIEAKADGQPGRCGRYEWGRCPEIHGGGEACRYWERGVRFDTALDIGARPVLGAPERPTCARHYQLARSLLMAQRLGEATGRSPHLALVLPRRRWPALRGEWQDFADRVRDEAQWKRLRALAWEDVRLGRLAFRPSRNPER